MLIPFATLALFSGAALLLALTPGPDMLFCLSRAIGQGRAAAFASLAGIMAGLCFYAIAAAFGLASLFDAVPLAYHAVRIGGALYLAWLAIQAFRAGNDPLGVKAVAAARWPVLFRQGLVTNLLNPKIILFFVALFPQFIDPARGSTILQGLILGAVFNVIGLSVNGGIILVAGTVAEWLRRRPGAARVQRWLMGTIFGGLALRLALDSGR